MVFAHSMAMKPPLRISRGRPFDKLTGRARLLRLPLKRGVIRPSNVIAHLRPPFWLRLRTAKPR